MKQTIIYVMIDGRNAFDQPINSKLKTYENVIENATGKGDDLRTGYLLDDFYFKENYKMIATDLSKQQALDAIQQQFIKIILYEI